MNQDVDREVNKPSIVIYGAGSIGCYLGGCLLAAQQKVTFIGRDRLQQQINQHGLFITDYKRRHHKISSKHIDYQLTDDALSSADYILVTVKSGDTLAAANAIKTSAQKQAVVISFQNGIGNAQTLREQLTEFTVLAGMVPFNVFSKGEGHFHCGTEGNLAVEDPMLLAQSFTQACEDAQLTVDRYDDLSGIQWSKLIMNLNNAVNALSGVPLLEQLNDPMYRKTMASIIKEALFILKQANIKPVRTGKVIPALLPYILSLPTWAFTRIASAMLKMDPTARSSMYEDLQLKRRTEIDYLNGELVRLAKTLEIDAPVNTAIVKLIKQAEENKEGSPMMSANLLYSKITF